MYKFTIGTKYNFYPSGVFDKYYLCDDMYWNFAFIGYKKKCENFTYYLIPVCSPMKDISSIDENNNFIINNVEWWELIVIANKYDDREFLENNSVNHCCHYRKDYYSEEELDKDLSKIFRDEKIKRLKEKL